MSRKNHPILFFSPGFGFRIINENGSRDIFIDDSIKNSKSIAADFSERIYSGKESRSKVAEIIFKNWNEMGGKVKENNRISEVKAMKFDFTKVINGNLRMNDRRPIINWESIEKYFVNQGYRIEMRKSHFLKKRLKYPFPIIVIKDKEGNVISEGKGFTLEEKN